MLVYRYENITVLIVSLLNAGLLAFGHARNSKVLLAGALLIFSISVIVWKSSWFLPIMLFYLPWSPVLKTSPYDFTLYTLIVPVVFLIVFLGTVKNREDYKIQHIVLPLFFFAYTMLIKMLNQLPIELSYLFFTLMLFFIPMYICKYGDGIKFEICLLFLSSGILSACAAAEILMKYPHMLEYIDVYKWEQVGLVRLSGFYGDSNYYSAQILVAIAGLLIILGKTASRILIALEIAAIIALIYFGMQSVSKMFILCTAGLVVLWIFNILIEKRSISYKFGLIASAVIIAGLAMANKIFAEEINLYLLRFGMVTDVSSLTTGRSILIKTYLNYLFSNTEKMVFGIGLSQDQVRILLNTNNAHNTVIEMIYQVGIIGSLILIWWWKSIYNQLVDKIKIDLVNFTYLLIMASAVLMPWFSLDILYFDEFFYFTILVLVSRNYLCKRRMINIIESYQAWGDKL